LSQHNCELGSLKASDCIIASCAAAEPGGDLLQQLISRCVAEGVVDILEPIQRNQHNANDSVIAVRTRNCLFISIDKERSVRKVGEFVVISEMLDFGSPFVNHFFQMVFISPFFIK